MTTKDESEALAWAEGRRLDAKGRTDPEPHARTLASGLRSRETVIEKFEVMEVEYLDTIRRQEAVIEKAEAQLAETRQYQVHIENRERRLEADLKAVIAAQAEQIGKAREAANVADWEVRKQTEAFHTMPGWTGEIT